MSKGRVWTRYSMAVAFGGPVVSVVVTTGWLLAQGTRGAEIANVLALPLAVLALLGTPIYAWISRPLASGRHVLAAWVHELRSRVTAHEAPILQRLLADTGGAQPAQVGFARYASSLVRWRADGGDHEGSLTAIAAYYRTLIRGRLVVLGDAGAGKSVLALWLLVELIRTSPPPDGRDGRGEIAPVPLRLSLSSFPTAATPDHPPEDLSPSDIAARLDSWIVGHLVTVYGVRRNAARELVAEGLVLPILDGLEEMDGDDCPDPVRAREVLRGLNHPVSTTAADGVGVPLRKVVVTCRSRRWRKLLEGPQVVDGHPGILQDATGVVLQPLRVEHIVQWLARRVPDPVGPDGIERRWSPVVARIRRRSRGALATAMGSPLRLFLVVTAYMDPSSRPRELLTVAAGDLDRHLFSRLITAVVAHHPNVARERWRPEDVTRWLAYLARHLAGMAAAGKSGTDLHLHELSLTTGSGESHGRAIHRLAVALYVASLAMATAVAVAAHSALGGFPRWGLVAYLALAAAGWRAARAGPDLRRLDLARLRTPAGRRWFWRGVGIGVGSGFILGAITAVQIVTATSAPWTFAVAFALTAGLVFGTGTGAFGGLMAGLASRPIGVSRPSHIVRQWITFDLAVVCGVPLAVATALGLALVLATVASVAIADAASLSPAIVMAAVAEGVKASPLWFALALPFGLALRARSPLLRYAVAVWRLSSASEVPRHLTQFLDWAYAAGLLRLSGVAIQFRHGKLQDWLLTAHAEPGVESVRRSSGRAPAHVSRERSSTG